MNRIANVLLVSGMLFGIASVIMGVLVVIKRESPDPDAGIGLTLLSLGLALVLLGIVLKRRHRKADDTVHRQNS